MKHRKLVLLPVCFFLASCAGSNYQAFNGNRYKLATAEIDSGRALYAYTTKDNPNRVLFVERQSFSAIGQDAAQYRKTWMGKEQQYRRNDCTITPEHNLSATYYVCRHRHAARTVVYVLDSDKDNGYAKILIDNNGLSPKQQQDAAAELLKLSVRQARGRLKTKSTPLTTS